MKLIRVQISEFESIRDSGEFAISDITCLVGKNEAGKTAVLQALYRLNPIIKADENYNVIDNYPRWDVEDYRHAVQNQKREPAIVAIAVFECEKDDCAAVSDVFGAGALKSTELVLSRGYANATTFQLQVDEIACLKHVIANAKILPEEKVKLTGKTDIAEMLTALTSLEQTVPVKELASFFQKVKKADGIPAYIYNNILDSRVPKFLYFNEYYQMKGHANIDSLKTRKTNKTLEHSDYPLLGLINLARLDIDEMLNPARTRDLKNKLEGAGNHLTKSVLKYWSQNRHLQLRFDVRPARPNDPDGMKTGTNVWGEVYDTNHMVTTELGSRSRGFVWFFSFLAWYSDVRRNNQQVILLLDEPGLFLHAKAQMDLLKYFEAEVATHNQLIYTTHSPFMIDPKRYDRVRIVQDVGIDKPDDHAGNHQGTKVLTDVLEATDDSLFPLQGALGYEISQNLFVGPNNLVVEGVSDLLYLQTMSGLLEAAGRIGLDQRWTITPVGGSDKVPTFVALLGAQKGLNVAVLIDFQKKDRQTIENLFKRKLLKKSQVITYAEFTGTEEADIEDMYDRGMYLDLVNAEYSSNLKKPIKLEDVKYIPRIVVAVEKLFATHDLKKPTGFNHYRPARRLSVNIGEFTDKIGKDTLTRFEELFKKLNLLLKGT